MLPVGGCGLSSDHCEEGAVAKRRFSHSSLSRYSPGTSSWGTSCVRTSPSSASPASCTPFTTSASKAFPSSSNSSTLSESAPSRLDNPCKSPDWPPERADSPSGENVTVSMVWLLPRTRFFTARVAFPTAFFLGAAFFFADFLFGVAAFFFCFFRDFFLVAIRAVYHWSTILRASTEGNWLRGGLVKRMRAREKPKKEASRLKI